MTTPERIALLRGGSWDGHSTVVAGEVVRLFGASRAPGMVDVYERTGETQTLDDGSTEATVYEFSTQQPIGELAPEMLHMPVPPG